MGIPGVPTMVILATGPSGNLHHRDDGVELFRDYFHAYVVKPVEELLRSLDEILRMCSGRGKLYQDLLDKLKSIPGYGELNAGDLSQDLFGLAGVCEGPLG